MAGKVAGKSGWKTMEKVAGKPWKTVENRGKVAGKGGAKSG